MSRSAYLRIACQVVATTAIIGFGFESGATVKKQVSKFVYSPKMNISTECKGIDDLDGATSASLAVGNIEHNAEEEKDDSVLKYVFAEYWDVKGRYRGTWLNGKKEGRGVLRYNNKFVYEGHFSNDLPHGEGKLTLPDGSTLQGMFAAGVLQEHAPIDEFGWACLRTRNGLLAEGELTFLEGNSDIFCGNGRITNLFTRRVYNGNIARGLPHGEGQMYTFRGKNTVVVSGTFDQGELVHQKTVSMYTPFSSATSHANHNAGRPFLIVKQGGHYIVGDEVNGRLHGPGWVHFADGTQATGMFFNNEMYGEWRVITKKKIKHGVEEQQVAGVESGVKEGRRDVEDDWKSDEEEVVTLNLTLSPMNRFRFWLKGEQMQ